ncbi:MAG: DUF2179 domain-containing protein [Phycisphaerae bacterium]
MVQFAQSLAGDSQFVFAVIMGAIIFALRLVEMSLDSLRIVSMVKGNRGRAGVLGFCEAMLFIYAISQALRPPVLWPQMVGYAAGFASGTYLGTTIATHFTSGYVMLRILSRPHAKEIVALLRDKGHRVTCVTGEGRDGAVPILFTVLDKKLAERAIELVTRVDERAFVTIEPIERAHGGYVPMLPVWWRPGVRR